MHSVMSSYQVTAEQFFKQVSDTNDELSLEFIFSPLIVYVVNFDIN